MAYRKSDIFRFESGGMARIREQKERNANRARRENLEKAREVLKVRREQVKIAYQRWLLDLYQAKEIVVKEPYRYMHIARHYEKKGLVLFTEEGVLTLGETKYRITIAGTNVNNVQFSDPHSVRNIDIEK